MQYFHRSALQELISSSLFIIHDGKNVPSDKAGIISFSLFTSFSCVTDNNLWDIPKIPIINRNEERSRISIPDRKKSDYFLFPVLPLSSITFFFYIPIAP